MEFVLLGGLYGKEVRLDCRIRMRISQNVRDVVGLDNGDDMRGREVVRVESYIGGERIGLGIGEIWLG